MLLVLLIFLFFDCLFVRHCKNFWSCSNQNSVIFIWSNELASKIFRFSKKNSDLRFFVGRIKPCSRDFRDSPLFEFKRACWFSSIQLGSLLSSSTVYLTLANHAQLSPKNINSNSFSIFVLLQFLL